MAAREGWGRVDRLGRVGRAGAVAAAGLLLAAVGLALLSQEPSPRPEQAEWQGPPLVPRDDTRPKLGEHPDLQLMGLEPGPSDAILCSEARVERMTSHLAGVAGLAEDGVFVDERGWNETSWGGRAGLASFWSKCLRGGGAVHVRAEHDGALLAVYEPRTGLTSP